MQFRHEAELADGKGVGKDNVGDGEKCSGKGDVIRWPDTPSNSGKTPRCVACFDTSGDDGDDDSADDGDEIDIAKNRKLGKGWWDGKTEEEDGRDDCPDQGTHSRLVDNADPCNSSSQGMGRHKEHQQQHKHDRCQMVTKCAPDEPDSVGIVFHMWKLELDLTNDVAGVDGEETNTNRQKHTSNHAHCCKGARNTQRSQGNGFDDQANGQLLPSEPLELLFAFLEGRHLLKVIF